MFSHSVGFLLILLMISFIVKKAFKPDVVPLVYFFFCFHYQRRYIGKNIAIRDVWDLTAYVSFWVFLIQPIRSAFLSIFSSDEKKSLISIMTFITISSCCAFFLTILKIYLFILLLFKYSFLYLPFPLPSPFNLWTQKSVFGQELCGIDNKCMPPKQFLDTVLFSLPLFKSTI